MKYYLFIIICVFLVSCLDKKDHIENIPLEKAMNNIVSFDLNKLTDSIRYIRLETNDSCLIKQIDKIELADRFLFIKNQKDGLYVFNLNGGYLWTIGRMGKGPGEYIALNDFFIDKLKNRVVIFDQNQSKIMEYGFNGEFKNEYRIQNYPDKVKKIDDRYYFSTSFMKEDTLMYEYEGNNIINKYTKNDFSLGQFKEHVLHFESLSTFEDSITYWNELNNYVFRIKNGTLSKRYFFDFGHSSYKINQNQQSQPDYKARSEYGSVERFIETKDYIFINSIFKGQVKHVLYDKRTKVASVIDNQLCNKNKLFNNLSFINTFDGIVNFWPDKNGILNDSVLYRTFYAYDFKKSGFCNPQNDKYSTNNKNLQKIIDESTYSDNPIIMIINL
jgi:hypothetical protein